MGARALLAGSGWAKVYGRAPQGLERPVDPLAGRVLGDLEPLGEDVVTELLEEAQAQDVAVVRGETVEHRPG